ncbi:MAG: cache domain-containing protein [Tenuifilaceae bacterium]|nr:cache domain-containing protein [Tenuifilaceae bacterium]
MKRKSSIRQKILLYILSVFVIFYLISIGYITLNARKSILVETKAKTELLAANYASEISRLFEKNITITRTLSQAFTTYKQMPEEQWTSLFLDMYSPVIKANPDIYIIWDSWEYSSYKPNYTKDFGRILMFVLREEDGSFERDVEERSMDGDPEIYGTFKQGNVDDIWEPYLDVVEGTKREARMLTTIASPVQIDNKFVGMVGVDVELTFLQDLVSSVDVVEGGFAFITSYTGIIAGHPDSDKINKNIVDLYPNETQREHLVERMQKGEKFSFVRDDNGNSHYMFFAPITVDGVSKNWSLAISIPYKKVLETANRSVYISLVVGLIALLIIVVLLILVSNNITRPVAAITQSLNKMALGHISNDLELTINSNDEIEEMAKAFNRSIEGLNSKTSFAHNIGKGELDSKLEMLSEDDILGKSLLDMRNSLMVAKQEELKRKEEERKRSWDNEGVAKFADILRSNNDNINRLADEIVKNLVKYMGTNQAVMFLLNENDPNDAFFELFSAYAWDRRKYLNKRIDVSEGLVGACAMEKETIQLTEIPEDYIEITSGLGKANPKYIVLVPLKHEGIVQGVIEMASFTIFEEFEVEFLERIADSIASTIQSVKINVTTKQLLEQSQQQAEEMLAQEEEMRQNMEELQATQEEMERKGHEQQQLQAAMTEEVEKMRGELELQQHSFDSIIDAIGKTAYIAEYSIDGRIVRLSRSLESLIEKSTAEVEGMHHSELFVSNTKPAKGTKDLWDILKNGKVFEREFKGMLGNQKVLLKEWYSPVLDLNGEVLRVISVSICI